MSLGNIEMIACPFCQTSNELKLLESGQSCINCGRNIPLMAHLCPNCYTYNEKSMAVCQACGDILTIQCNQCRADNWSGSLECRECGISLDKIDRVISGAYGTTAQRLNKQMAQAIVLKQQEEIASSKRMAELIAAEEARQKDLQERTKKQKEQERLLLIIMFVAVAVFFLGLIIYALINTFAQ